MSIRQAFLCFDGRRGGPVARFSALYTFLIPFALFCQMDSAILRVLGGKFATYLGKLYPNGEKYAIIDSLYAGEMGLFAPFARINAFDAALRRNAA